MENVSVPVEEDVVVVIGGTTGIGRAISEFLAEQGAKVVPTSRTESSVTEAAKAVGSDVICPTDVTKRSNVVTLFERVTDSYGSIDTLVNCAGIVQEVKPVGELTDGEWSTVIDTNLYGVFLASQIVPEYMDSSDKAILNVSSMNGEVAVKGLAAYSASKAGVNSLTRTLALEYASEDIRVNAIAPGYVMTRQNEDALEDEDIAGAIRNRTPLSRFGTLEEIAAMSGVLVSPVAAFMTGEVVRVDGGFGLR